MYECELLWLNVVWEQVILVELHIKSDRSYFKKCTYFWGIYVPMLCNTYYIHVLVCEYELTWYISVIRVDETSREWVVLCFVMWICVISNERIWSKYCVNIFNLISSMLKMTCRPTTPLPIWICHISHESLRW